MKEEIQDVKEVRFTNKLKTHPVCLTSEGDVLLKCKKYLMLCQTDMGIKAQTVLEINEKHPLLKTKILYKKE